MFLFAKHELSTASSGSFAAAAVCARVYLYMRMAWFIYYDGELRDG